MIVNQIPNSIPNKDLQNPTTIIPGLVDQANSSNSFPKSDSRAIANVSNIIAMAENGRGRVTPIPGSAKHSTDGSWLATQLSVRGPFNAPATNPATPGGKNPAAVDAGYNSNAYRVVSGNPNGQPSVIFVNGINTDLPTARQTAASLSKLTGTSVDLVYNSSDPAVAGQKTFDHFDRLAKAKAQAAAESLEGIYDPVTHRSASQEAYSAVYSSEISSAALGKQASEWAKTNTLHNPPAAQTTANLILDQLLNTEGPVKVIGYSQGGTVAAEALRRLETQLVNAFGKERAADMLSRVRVLGLGAAAERTDFPAASQFNGIAHKGDFIARYFGITAGGDAPGVGTILSALKQRGVEQHLNYVDGQSSPKSHGDPKSEQIIQQWFSGQDVGTQELPNFNKEKTRFLNKN